MRSASIAVLFVGLLVAMSVSGSAGESHPVAQPFGATLGSGEPSAPADFPVRALQVEPILMAADHIVAQQCYNGGFGWPQVPYEVNTIADLANDGLLHIVNNGSTLAMAGSAITTHARTENKIAFSRQGYNDQVLDLNNKIQMFPSNIIAGMFGFIKREFFEIEAAAEREVPKVSFES